MDTYDKLAKAAGVPVTVLLGEEIQTNTATEGHDPVLLEILENMLDQAINRDEIDLSKKERKELIEAVYAVAQKHLRSGINITNHRLMRDIGREISDRVLKDHD